ncbi:Vesicle-associated membrane protein/synaptobrevin-binding protein, partial [Stegodyphus mimosarum]
MAKMEQALILDPPSELRFKAPFTDVTTSFLSLTNPTDKQICFKVKTTAPKTYCVRPNSGVVAPKETIVVAVMLQPLDLENADRNRHKFMVQSMFVPDGEFNQETVWRDVPPEGLMNSKLKCVFDIPADSTQVSAEVAEQPKVEQKATHHVQEVPVKSCEVETESKKLYEENKKLKRELFDLRQENSSLKEEGLRSRVAHDTRTRGTSVKPAESEMRHSPFKKQ